MIPVNVSKTLVKVVAIGNFDNFWRENSNIYKTKLKSFLSDEDIMEISDVQVKAPKLIKCEEDDDFVNMFDKMMTETLKETKGSTVSNSQQNIVAPLHLRPKSKSYADPTLPPDHQDDVPEEKTIQFAVLMRKGQKQTLKEVAVPKDSEMAVNLLKQEEAQKLEKERMKKLTLEINERQEEEDLNEAIAQVIFLNADI